MAIYEYSYNEDLVCNDCGKRDYHINITFYIPAAEMYHDQDIEVWCYVCERETDLVEKEEAAQ